MIRRVAMLALVIAVTCACSWDYPIWIPRNPAADPLYRFVQGDKAGYIDQLGKVVIPPTFPAFGNSGSVFMNGLLEISASSGVYVDATGQRPFKKEFYRGWDFSEGLAVVARPGEKLWGYIDATGEFAIPPQFKWSQQDYVWPFSDGYGKIEVDGKFGYIGRSGKFVIQPTLLDASNFKEGMARIVAEGSCSYTPDGPCGFANPVNIGSNIPWLTQCKFTFINKRGKIISDQRFDSARDFSEGLAAVQIGKVWGFIDKTGKFAIPPRFQEAQSFGSGLARVSIPWKPGYGYIDATGQLVIPPSIEFNEDFHDGLAVAGSRDKSYWYINMQGQRAFTGEFALASPFFKGLAHVMLAGEGYGPGTFAYINTSGRILFRYTR